MRVFQINKNALKILVFFVLGACNFAQANEKPVSAGTFNGQSISLSEVDDYAKLSIYEAKQALYAQREAAFKRLILNKMIQQDPQSKDLDEKSFIEKYIVNILPVTNEDIDDFAKQQNIPKEKLDAKLRAHIVKFIQSQQYTDQIELWMEQQKEKYPSEFSLMPPPEPVFDIAVEGAPYLGGKDAKVTIVEFSDFECPYCKKGSELIEQVLSKYSDKIKFVYKQFPLNSIHKFAQKAAEASLCAREQGEQKFWQMHDVLFADNKNINIPQLQKKAELIGLDKKQFDDCLISGKTMPQVQADLLQGVSLGVSSTPAFFINGRLQGDGRTLESFSKVIDELLVQ